MHQKTPHVFRCRAGGPRHDAPMQPGGDGLFPTTQWTLIARLKSIDAAVKHRALDDLCTQYHYPLYCCIRHRGLNHHDAQDILQDFLGDLLRRSTFQKADEDKGRLRALLAVALRRFLINWQRDRPHRHREQSVDMEGALADSEERYQKERFTDDDTPERIFDRKWALELLDRALRRLRDDYFARGRKDLFKRLRPILLRGGSLRGEDALKIAESLGMKESALRAAHSRLLKDFGEALEEEVQQTVSTEEEVQEELAYLRALFAGR
jgi:hypothetical protein